MLKYILAAVFSAAAVFLAGLLGLLVDTAPVYGLAVVAGLVIAGVSSGEGKSAWILGAVLFGFGIGTVLVRLMDQPWGTYLVVLGLGAIGGLLALMLAGRRSSDPLSGVHASKGHHGGH